MNIAIVLTHNKTDKENSDQITSLKALLIEVTDGPFDEFDEEGKVIGQFTTIHHELIGLSIPHEAKLYQIVPFGVEPPPNRYEVNSGGIVYYGKGDEDKVGDHPRFFNWGLKRATDYGADIVIHLEDYKKFNLTDLPIYLNFLIDPSDPHELIDNPDSKISTLKLLTQVGQLDESKTKEQAITELKQRVIDKGFKNG